jgi:hypothetical protein
MQGRRLCSGCVLENSNVLNAEVGEFKPPWSGEAAPEIERMDGIPMGERGSNPPGGIRQKGRCSFLIFFFIVQQEL